MIVALIQRRGTILAVNNVGELIFWQTSARRHSFGYRFEQNVSLLPSSASIKISKGELLGLVALQNTIVAFGPSNLAVVDDSKLKEEMDESVSEVVRQIKLVNDLQENEKINCLVAVDEENVVFGTSHNHLYLYNILTQAVVLKKNLNLQKTQELTLFAASSTRIPEITAMTVLRDKQLLAVGCDNGKILTVDGFRLEVINQITQTIKSPLEKVTRLSLTSNEQKLYSIHQNYIIEWNYKLNLALGCYEYSNGTGAIEMQGTLYLGGSSNALSRVKQQISSLQVSMRCVGVMKQMENGVFAAGGADNLIDVFQNGMRLMTLFKK